MIDIMQNQSIEQLLMRSLEKNHWVPDHGFLEDPPLPIYTGKDYFGGQPDTEPHSGYIQPPGRILFETLGTLGMSQSELAQRLNGSVQMVRDIIHGAVPITVDLASRLEQVVDRPASVWLQEEQRHQEFIARLARDPRLESWEPWLDLIPVQEIMRRGWMPTCTKKSRQVFEALRFFDMASPEDWLFDVDWQMTLYCHPPILAISAQIGAISTWLRQGELEAKEINSLAIYKEETFRDILQTVRGLIGKPLTEAVRSELIQLCATAGVAVVFVDPYPLMDGIYGAVTTHNLMEGIPTMEFIPQHQTDERFWFTFFHQASHILLHDLYGIAFLDAEGHFRRGKEKEADAFAWDLLMPPAEWQPFITQKLHHTAAGIQAFAETIGLPPAMVIARLEDEDLQDEE